MIFSQLASVYVLVFLLLQRRFFEVFRQKDYQLISFHITGISLQNTFFSYNLSWAIWLNGWYVVTTLIHLFFTTTPTMDLIREWVDFNTLLFISFSIGNLISNSDMITVKSSFWRLIGSSFVFGTSLSMTYLLLNSIKHLEIPIIVNFLFLIAVVFLWKKLLQHENRINYIQYYL